MIGFVLLLYAPATGLVLEWLQGHDDHSHNGSFRSLELYSQFLSNPDDFLSEHIKIILYTSMIRYRHS